MSPDNVELVRSAYERWEPLDLVDLGHAVVAETRIVVVGRSSDVRIEADETDVWWFRDGRIVRLAGFPVRAEAIGAAEALK